MVKITVFREDNQPVLHLQRRQSASASHFEKTIVPVLKKTILLEKTILPFPEIPVLPDRTKYGLIFLNILYTKYRDFGDYY